MTSRDMTAAMIAAIAANTVRPAIFYEGQYASEGASAEKMLLHLDGADGATATTDAYGNTVTFAAAGTTLSTTHAKFGTSSLKGNGATNPGGATRGIKITGPARMGSGSWTWECWLYIETFLSPFAAIFLNATHTDGYNTGYGVMFMLSMSAGPTANLRLSLSASGTWDIVNDQSIDVTAALGAGAWHHFALTFDSAAGHYYTYVDGVMKHDITSALSVRDTPYFYVVPSEFSGVAYLGWIDEPRLYNTCRYPSGTTFTPPTSAFTLEQYVRLFTGLGTIDWNGYTWTGGGDLLSISPIEEKVGIEAVGFSVRLSGVPSASITRALDSMQQGLPGKLWLALFDAAGALIADPYMLRRGKFDITVIERTGETCTIQVNYEDRLIDLERPRGRRYTTADQQRDYPTDLGFNMVQSIQDMQVLWR